LVCGDVAVYVSGSLLVCGDVALYISGSLLVYVRCTFRKNFSKHE